MKDESNVPPLRQPGCCRGGDVLRFFSGPNQATYLYIAESAIRYESLQPRQLRS
jgi:hypothetical protein